MATDKESVQTAQPAHEIDRALSLVPRPRAAEQEQGTRLDSGGRVDRRKVAFNVFKNFLDTQDLRAALYSLLRLTDFRFIAIFRFKGGSSTSVVYVDRENLNDLQAAEVPDTATYCQFARLSSMPFVTANASSDPRTSSHAAKDAVLSYCGLPITSAAGEFIGTLCHFDVVPRDPSQIDAELVTMVARELERSGLIPAYPAC